MQQVMISTNYPLKKNDIEYQLSVVEQVVMQGDLSKLNPEQRVLYYRKVCESSGLNPYTRPFDYIQLNGKLTLYAKKDATEQLRKLNGISIEKLESQIIDDLYIVKATAKTKDGRTDESTGAVTIGNLKGEAKANAIMKAETKAKRRVTLSISGMGWTDESEIESIPNAKTIEVDLSTGEIKNEITKITHAQVEELEMILGDCSKEYKAWFYDYLKTQYQITNLNEVTTDIYPKMKDSATAEMEKNRTKQLSEAII